MNTSCDEHFSYVCIKIWVLELRWRYEGDLKTIINVIADNGNSGGGRILVILRQQNFEQNEVNFSGKLD